MGRHGKTLDFVLSGVPTNYQTTCLILSVLEGLSSLSRVVWADPSTSMFLPP